MNVPAKKTEPDPPGNETSVGVDLVSVPKMHRLLAQAAQLASDVGLPPHAFAGAAWHAYLQAFPALAEQMAEAHFEAALEELRSTGRLAKA